MVNGEAEAEIEKFISESHDFEEYQEASIFIGSFFLLLFIFAISLKIFASP